MPAPFAAETWLKRSDIPNIPLNGVYSGIVQGPLNATYDSESRVVQVFSKQAHHFRGYSSSAQSSTDDGASWVTTYDPGDLTDINNPAQNTVVAAGWALPHPSGEGGRIHYQYRWTWQHAFLLADGSIPPGGIDLYASENGVAFQFLQRLHSWQALNQIGGNGGSAIWSAFPSVAPPILLPGTGPDGEDAYWMATSYNFNAGGLSNRTTFNSTTLWRSIDGGLAWDEVRDLEPVFGTTSFVEFVQSTSGRLLLNASSAFLTDDVDDLINATFTLVNGLPGANSRGRVVQMYGGTYLTHQQGGLVSGGNAFVSCDNGENFQNTTVLVTPTSGAGFLRKLGPTEALIVTSGFNDPSTETVALYSSDSGETWATSEPWNASVVGERPVYMSIRAGGTPIVVTSSGGCYISSDTARGVAGTRTICPLANAGLASARRLILCGGVITPDCQE